MAINKKIFLFCFVLPFLLVACVSQNSRVAKMAGYEKSTEVQAGPYQLHYGNHNEQTNSDDFVLLAEGNWNIFSRYSEGNDVYLDGLPFIHFERMSDGSLTNLQMTIYDVNRKEKIGLVDRNADGQWDMKIDYVEGKIFTWTNGQWMFRYQMKQTNQH
jgi:hypothetical protein